MFAQQGDLFVMDVTKEDFKTMCHSSKRPSHTSTQHKVVQEVQAQEDQNTGNKARNVDIVDMIRSMGLHAKSANVQEMSIVHELEDINPVFHTPVNSQIVMTTWENCQKIMEPKTCVATPVEHCIFETKQINMIMVHDMELKGAHYSNVFING